MNRLLQKFVDWGKSDCTSMMQQLEEKNLLSVHLYSLCNSVDSVLELLVFNTTFKNISVTGIS